jgi:hypothetical protein
MKREDGMRGMEFELAYLALLTQRGLKPLSRWEGPWDAPAREMLRALGLRTRVVRRATRHGGEVSELLFSPSERCLDLYARHFADRPLRRTREDVRRTGRLFGYPSCCVEHFARRGYAPNALAPEEQRLLFHWACPRCALTPLLLPHYRRAHEDCRRWRETGRLPAPPAGETRPARRGGSRLALAAAWLLAIGGSPAGALAGVVPPEPHWLPLEAWQDADHDFLTADEERSLGLDPANPDENHNHRPDGADRALALLAQLDALPAKPNPDGPYVEHHEVKGLERCEICGKRVNMGHLTVINPREHLRLEVPYIARHFLAHGGFSYHGTEHEGRVNVALLNVVLNGKGDSHWLPVSPDPDHDFLTDAEEAALKSDPADPDEDRNHVPDGVDRARAWAAELEALPTEPQGRAVYRREFLLRGLERCDLCGTTVNMGHVTVVNPRAGLYARLPYLALHAMEHGSFSFAGDVHGRGRAALWLLDQTLHADGPSHLRPLEPWEDSDQDGLKDHEEARFGRDPRRADSNQDGVPDGFAVARALGAAVEALPATPNATCYAVDHRLRGLVPCDICGEMVNRGWREVINPRERLQVRVPYLALHALRHGSLAYTKSDRINPCRLDVALHGDGASHLVLTENDTDQDGLLDFEEAHFGTDPGQADSRGDGVLDGVRLAREMYERIAALPTRSRPGGTWVEYIWADCDAPCPVCGERVNCGMVELTNDWAGLKMSFSCLALHYLQHGSFAHPPKRRVDPLRLETLLQPAVLIHCAAGRATLRWMSRVGRAYELHVAPDLNGPWTRERSWKGTGREIEYQDPLPAGGRRRFYKVVVR